MKDLKFFIVIVTLMVGGMALALFMVSLVDTTNTYSVGEGHFLPYSTMQHPLREITPYPTVSLNIIEDSVDGWNIELTVENHEFSPKNASETRVDGEGHAHLYINNDKIARLYGPWFHLPSNWFEPGEHEIKVTLSSNDHFDLAKDDQVISDVKMIRVE